MYTFLPNSPLLVLTKVSYTNLLTTLETCPYFFLGRDATHSYPQYSNSMRWNNTIVYILLLKLLFMYYNALSRIYLYTYSNVSHYVVDIKHQINSRKLSITNYFFLNSLRLIQVLIPLYSLLTLNQSYLSNPTYIKSFYLNLVRVIHSLTLRIYYSTYYISLDLLVLL